MHHESKPSVSASRNGNRKSKRSLFFTWLIPAGLAALALTLAGCGNLFSHSSPNRAEVKAFAFGTNNVATSVTLTSLQLQVMRLADTYATVVAQAADECIAKAATPEARLAGMKWKLGQATSAYVDAAGQNPVLNALDLIVLVSLARIVVDDYGLETFGPAAAQLQETHRMLEAKIWALSSGFLKPAQQAELRGLIREWRERNPNQRYIGAIRFREFVTALGKAPVPSKTSPTSIFSLLFLDPMAGLDPTAAAIEETRQLGERAMYYTQRMPLLLSWQTEVLAYQVATQPESKQVLSNANSLAKSAEMFANTTAQLPQLIKEERHAAIQQLLDGLTSQSQDVRQTLTAGGEAATAINGAIKSLDSFVRYVTAPDTNGTAAANGKPFNVLDYGTAAGQVGAAARDLNVLLATMNESAPQLAQLGQQTTANASRVVDQAFWRGVILIGIFLVGAVVAGLIYRVLANKIGRSERRSE